MRTFYIVDYSAIYVSHNKAKFFSNPTTASRKMASCKAIPLNQLYTSAEHHFLIKKICGEFLKITLDSDFQVEKFIKKLYDLKFFGEELSNKAYLNPISHSNLCFLYYL